jgi:hypothetical protein
MTAAERTPFSAAARGASGAGSLIAREEEMFGKPGWFRAKRIGWGLIPIRWQGWTYAVCWVAGIALPFMLLLARHQPLEATAWLALAVSGLIYDVWQILSVIRGPLAPPPGHARASVSPRKHGILYISDSRAG